MNFPLVNKILGSIPQGAGYGAATGIVVSALTPLYALCMNVLEQSWRFSGGEPKWLISPEDCDLEVFRETQFCRDGAIPFTQWTIYLIGTTALIGAAGAGAYTAMTQKSKNPSETDPK